MEGLRSVLKIGIILTCMLMWGVLCSEDMDSVINMVEGLNEDVVRVEERVTRQINWAKVSLKSEIKQHISEHVREAITGILQGESIEEMLRSQVITEVRQLRRGNQQMKRQLHRVLMSLRDVQKEMNTHKEAKKEGKLDVKDFTLCSKYILESEVTKKELELSKTKLEECHKAEEEKDKSIAEVKQNLEILNRTYQLHLRQVDSEIATTQQSMSSESTGASTPLTTVARAKPEEEKSRILIAPLYSPKQHQIRQVDIHTNSASTYQLRSLKEVISIAYVSKLRKILLGLRDPDKIISSNLDSKNVDIVRKHVETYGMAVDEEREVVFMTTDVPFQTISRITTQGKHFTVVIDLDRAGYPRGIAINPKKKKIYFSTIGSVFSVSYDGSGFQRLATGSNMLGITLDNTGSILYYNDNKNLMKLYLSQNVSEIATTLSVYPRTFRYYHNTVYFSSCCVYTGKLGAVDVEQDTVTYTLQTLNLKGVSEFGICLV